MELQSSINITTEFKKELDYLFDEIGLVGELAEYYETFKLEIYSMKGSSSVVLGIGAKYLYEYSIPQYDFGKDLLGKFVRTEGKYGYCRSVRIQRIEEYSLTRSDAIKENQRQEFNYFIRYFGRYEGAINDRMSSGPEPKSIKQFPDTMSVNILKILKDQLPNKQFSID